ncbi:MAG TPA: hypothetical protein VJS64_01160, partial [Pyrinomonadaceae bacterium]|nr:hypothetical protein [Pyrinomonadaceae bacterium]
GVAPMLLKPKAQALRLSFKTNEILEEAARKHETRKTTFNGDTNRVDAPVRFVRPEGWRQFQPPAQGTAAYRR